MEHGILLGMLGLFAMEDIKRRSITLSYVVLFGGIGIVWQLFGQGISIPSMGLGVAVGLGIIALSQATRGSIGMGDGWIFCVTGIFLGGSRNVELLMMSLLYAALFSLGVLIVRRKDGNKRKKEIPFLPFAFLGYLTLAIGEVL